MVAQGGLRRLQQPIGQPADAGVVLGMDHDQGTLAAGDLQNVQHLVIVELQPLVVR